MEYKDYYKALEINPNNLLAYSNLSVVKNRLEDFENANKYLEKYHQLKRTLS